MMTCHIGTAHTWPRARAMSGGPTSFYARSAALSEALQALLAAAVVAATEGDKGAASLSQCAARFDGAAAALEQDLLTLARASPPQATALPVELLRSLAEREAIGASGR